MTGCRVKEVSLGFGLSIFKCTRAFILNCLNSCSENKIGFKDATTRI